MVTGTAGIFPLIAMHDYRWSHQEIQYTIVEITRSNGAA